MTDISCAFSQLLQMNFKIILLNRPPTSSKFICSPLTTIFPSHSTQTRLLQTVPKEKNKYRKPVGVCGLDSFRKDIDYWWALVNTVMNLGFYKKTGELLDYMSDY
jgi:hypothetical protein